MQHGKNSGGDQDDSQLRPNAGTKEFPEALEHPSAKKRFLSEPGDNDHEIHHKRKRGCIPGDPVVGLIDWRRAEERHDGGFHRKLERDAEKNSDGDRSYPTARPNVTDLPPRSIRKPRPQQDKNGAQRCKQKVTAENDQDRQNPERAKAAQLRREIEGVTVYPAAAGPFFRRGRFGKRPSLM